MSATQSRTPWVLVGMLMLGCLALCLLMALVGGGAYLLSGWSQAASKTPPPAATSIATATQISTLGPRTSSGRVAFVSGRDGGDAIYVMNADGSQQIRVSGKLPMSGDPVWSPDGKRIAFTSSAPASPGSDYFLPSIFVMNADGSQ